MSGPASMSLKILLVDDHAGFVSAAARHLRRLPWATLAGTAGSGAEALALCQALRPDVVLMDLAMPGMNGLDACRQLKAMPDPPHVVIASDLDDGEHRAHAARAGADAFVSKRAYIQELMPLLEALARRAGHSDGDQANPSEVLP